LRSQTIAIWDAQTLTLSHVVRDLRDNVWNPVFARDSRTILAGAYTGALFRLDPFAGTPAEPFTSHTRFARRVLFSPGGEIAVSTGLDGLLKVWDPGAGRCVASLKGCGDEAFNAAWIPGTRQVAVTYRSGDVEVWDLGFYERHILGNAPYHIASLARDPASAESAQRLRSWVEGRMP
jgi:WD40 repeat protein